MLVIERAPLPVFVSVTDCDPLVVLIVWLTNVKLADDKLTSGAVPEPVPLRTMACGLPEALSVMATEPA